MSSELHNTIRVRLEYEQEGFAECLPCEGVIVGRIQDVPGTQEWLVLQLDEPVEYQLKIGDPFQYRLIRAEKLVIRSRLQDRDVGGREWTSVHVLLPLRDGAAEASLLDLKAFHHVAWARCQTVS